MPISSRELNKGEFISEGNEKKVYNAQNNPDLVIKDWEKKSETDKLNPRFLKGQFYLKKIFCLLFPENIPDTYAAEYGDNLRLVNEKINITDNRHLEAEEIRRKISGGVQSNEDRERTIMLNVIKDERIKELNDKMLQTGVQLDTQFRNWAIENGKVIYLDDFLPWSYHGQFTKMYNFEQLRNFIFNELKDKEAAKSRALSYLDRLEGLYHEEAHERVNDNGTRGV